MTELLDRAFAIASKLPPEQQDAIARELLARVGAAPSPKRSPESVRRAFEEAKARLAALPVLDHRSPDDILGYGENGLPL